MSRGHAVDSLRASGQNRAHSEGRGVGRCTSGAPVVMARLGIELGSHAIRAGRVEGWPRARTRVVEIEGDLDALDDAVRALHDDLGTAHGVALAIDLPLLRVK